MADLTSGGLSATVSTSAPTGLRSASADQFRVVIDQEILVVQASATGASPWTILTRGAEGSAAAAHTSGTSIYHFPTAGALEGRYVSRTQVPGGSFGASYSLALIARDTWLTGTLAANLALTVTGLSAGDSATLMLTQDATGGRTLTINGTAVPIPSAASAFFTVQLHSPDGTDLDITVPGGAAGLDPALLGVASGVARVGSDGYVGGTAGTALKPSVVDATSGTAVGIGPRTGSTLSAPYLRDFVAADDFFTAGDTDDTNRINAAATAAINKGLRLHVHGPRTVSSTINLRNPNSGNPQVMLDMDCGGSGGSTASPTYGYWTWAGGNTTSFIKCINLVRSTWTGLKLTWADSKSGIVGFDLDTTTSGATANMDCSTFIGCHVACGLPATATAWRMGESSPSGANISVMTWLNCTVTFTYRGYVSGATSDATGWRLMGNNALVLSWFGGGASGCNCAFTTIKDASGTFNGSNSLYWYALSQSYNAIDFQVAQNGVFTIHGGRFELGQRFIDEETGTATPGTTSGATDISVIGVMCGGYNPSDGILVRRTNGGHMSMTGCNVYGATHQFDANMFTCSNLSTYHGTLTITDCTFYATAPFYTTSGGIWKVYLSGNIGTDSTGHTTTAFNDAPSIAVPQSNYVATTDPLVTSDSAAGYTPGSEWVNTITGVFYKCLSNAVGAAVWFWSSAANVQVFTATGTWTKPKWVSTVQVALIAGGGGGGSGRRGASGTAWSGGAGGGGGGHGFAQFNAAELGATATVTIGATGAGGAAQTVDSTNGNAGTASGQAQFGQFLRAQPGAAGAAGASGASAGGPGGVSTVTGGAGGNGTLGAAGAAGASGNAGGPGGGGGAGLAATPVFLAGGAGGQSIPNGAQAGGAGGATDGAAGSAGTAVPDLNLAIPGSGGGGGASSATTAAGAGGAGAAYGAGGGGGGASLNGQNSGAGGAPGAGVCVVISR